MNWRWKDIKMLFETVPTWFIITAFLAIIIGESNADPSTECPAVDLPENGRLQYGKFEGSDIYIVICNAGFIVNGSSVVKCVEGEWEKPPPKCEEIKESQYCEEPPIPTHGSRICGEAIYPVGKKCKFKCKKTHFLRGPKIRTCQENLLWSGRKPICVLKPVCPSLRPLINGTVINCSPTDPPRSGDTCSFRCNPGFVLEGPQSLFCKPNGRLEDELFRETYPICVAGKPISSIADVGSNRNLNSLLNLCRSKGCSHKCNIINGIAKCLCPSAYQLFEDGKTCQGLPKHKPENPPTRKPQDNSDETNSTESSVQTSSIDTCQINNGNCSHFCSFVFGSAKCSCPAGYRLQEDRKTCEDIDECAEGKHKCSHQCHNNLGKYTCSCPPGYLLIDDLKCEGCRINSYKSEIEDVCLECPVNSYTKSEGKTSIADCLCYSGFTGDPAHNIPCEDIDECESENFGCSHTCMNMPGSAQCLCPLGYELQQDNKTCIDKDECSIKNGGCEGACHNSPGSFSCSCGTGYTSSQKDRFSCDDVDECEVDNGGCEQRCINYAGSFYCSCEDGYRLAADQKTCIAASCPREPVPNHLRMQCFTKNGTRLSSSSDSENRPHSELNDYPIGTKCQFKCDNGFKLTAEGKITCRDDGTWSGPVPECKGLHCPALEAPEHGEVRPPACTLGNVSVKKKCYFTCQPGYKLQGPPVMLCKNNRSWNKPEPPVCRSVSVNPSLSCPEDISVDLSPGQNYTTVVIPRPQTNTEDFSITPKWVLTETPLSFPSGRTDITFTVVSSNPKKQDKTCTMTVNVVDREPPIFLNCPESFDVEATSMQGTSVKWEEPRAVDNVGVESVSKNLEPDATLMPGVHIVTYRARDAAGNAAVCSFEINITSTQCNDLEDPANGEANCVDWIYGKLCQPFCDAGYTRNPDEYPYYTCDESGVWAPVDVISDCLKYLPASSKNCPEGYEYRKINETNEEICLECPTETIWSPSSRTCEEASFEEEDDNDEEEET